MKIYLIEGKKISLRFKMNAIKEFAKIQGIEYVSDVQQVFAAMDPTNLKFSEMEMIARMIYCAIQDGKRVNGTELIEIEDLNDFIFENPEALSGMLEELFSEMVQKTDKETADSNPKAPTGGEE